MFDTQLKSVFYNIFEKVNTQAQAGEDKLRSQTLETFAKFPQSLGDMSPALETHLEQNGLVFNLFAQDHEYKATTQMLIDQIDAMLKAFNLLYSKKFGKGINTQPFKDKYIKNIQEKFNIDVLRQQKGDSFSIKHLRSLLTSFNAYVEKDIVSNLYSNYYHDEPTKFDVDTYSDKDRLEFLKLLRKAEIETVSKTQRKSVVNLEEETGYFTAEIPLGLDEDGKPYTLSCYTREGCKLANYVLHVMGHRDPDTGKVTILDQSTRAANFVPINTPNDVLMLRNTLAQVKQGHDSVRALNPNATTYNQISLLSPLHNSADNVDEQLGRKQSLYTYLAFLMQNATPEAMQMRLMIEGVNTMRSHNLSDPLQSQINTRSYNQIICDVFKKVSNFTALNMPTPLASLKVRILTINETPELVQLQKDIAASWKHIENLVATYKQQLESPDFDEEELSQSLKSFEYMLASHHLLERQLFLGRQKLWAKHQSSIKYDLQQLKETIDTYTNLANKPQLVEQYNLIQELNNFYFLHEDHRYQQRTYNYQLQACLHRLTANLGQEKAVNCNDSRDRTGVENYVVMASLQYVKCENQGFAPNISEKKTLNTIKTLAKKQQSKDAGMSNTAANGVPGHQVDTKDVDGFVSAEGVEMAKQTKRIYRPILKKDSWSERMKGLSLGEKAKAFGKFLYTKASVAFKPDQASSNPVRKVLGRFAMGFVAFCFSLTVATASAAAPSAQGAKVSPGNGSVITSTTNTKEDRNKKRDDSGFTKEDSPSHVGRKVPEGTLKNEDQIALDDEQESENDKIKYSGAKGSVDEVDAWMQRKQAEKRAHAQHPYGHNHDSKAELFHEHSASDSTTTDKKIPEHLGKPTHRPSKSKVPTFST